VNLIVVTGGSFPDTYIIDNIVLNPASATVPETGSALGLLFLSLTALVGMGARLRSLQPA
jgi:hypothetical protein